MTMTTARHKLPLIVPGQAQKEMFHNESLAAIDALIAPVIEALAPAAIPAAPQDGQCWTVGAAPAGAWAGQAHALACWTNGGWRFQAPTPRMRVAVRESGLRAEWTGTEWRLGEITAAKIMIAGHQVVGPRAAAIADASGGATVDAEARTAIAAMLASLRAHGLIA